MAQGTTAQGTTAQGTMAHGTMVFHQVPQSPRFPREMRA
jgi:hypothetical protein